MTEGSFGTFWREQERDIIGNTSPALRKQTVQHERQRHGMREYFKHLIQPPPFLGSYHVQQKKHQSQRHLDRVFFKRAGHPAGKQACYFYHSDKFFTLKHNRKYKNFYIRRIFYIYLFLLCPIHLRTMVRAGLRTILQAYLYPAAIEANLAVQKRRGKHSGNAYICIAINGIYTKWTGP